MGLKKDIKDGNRVDALTGEEFSLNGWRITAPGLKKHWDFKFLDGITQAMSTGVLGTTLVWAADKAAVDEAYSKGYDAGRARENEAYGAGYVAGQEQGFDDGAERGYFDGYEAALDENRYGYDDGFADGLAAADLQVNAQPGSDGQPTGPVCPEETCDGCPDPWTCAGLRAGIVYPEDSRGEDPSWARPRVWFSYPEDGDEPTGWDAPELA